MNNKTSVYHFTVRHARRCCGAFLTGLFCVLFLSTPVTAEIYKCDKMYQSTPCASHGEEVSLPRLSSYSSAYDDVQAPRYSLKDENVSSLKKSKQSDAENQQLTPREKLRALEEEAKYLKKNSSRLLNEAGSQHLYGQARALLIQTHILCTADFEKETLSIANRCQDLRQQIAEVSKFANSSRTLARE